jgi:prepilin peptidase CpaA
MSASDWVQVLAAGATVLLLLSAAVSDLARYRIRNKVVYAIVAAFVVGAVADLAWPALGWSVLAGVVTFAIGAALFAFGVFGGGDVKLVAAMALWTGFADLPRFLLVMTAAGGVLGLVWLVKRRLRPVAFAAEAGPTPDPTAVENPSVDPSHEAAHARKVPNRIPYGVAIAIAGLDFFVRSAQSPFAPLWPWMQ